MRLFEFAVDSMKNTVVTTELQKTFRWQRVGGAAREYEVDTLTAAVYVLPNSVRAVAICWNSQKLVERLYVWDEFDITRSPNWQLDIPLGTELADIQHLLIDWIANPSVGQLMETQQIFKRIISEARRTTAEEFIQMAKAKFGDRANALSMKDLRELGAENDVQVPNAIWNNYKINSFTWNLSGESATASDDERAGLAQAMGAPIEEPDQTLDPVYNDMVQLAKVKTAAKLASSGKLYLMGRKPNGAFFSIKGFDQTLASLERMLSNQIAAAGGSDRKNMAEQYEEMNSKVTLVASGQSNFIKSLLITGAPSSGKTYNVMKTIKSLGLAEGRDYVVKKGRITAMSMYRTLIEQVDGMVIFDDCDSVVDDKNGVNMLKGALDTDPIRELSYDVRGTLNTAVMDYKERVEVVNAIARILRGKPTAADVEKYSYLLKKKKKSSDEMEDDEDFGALYDLADLVDDSKDTDMETVHELQAYFSKHLPNKIDFRGRVIFISNMEESQWDSAILTRAFTVNMNFTSQEMLDYIDEIKDGIKTPGLTDEQKQEVVDFIRNQFNTGKLKRQINFRLVQQCFDLRLVNNWKALVSQL